MSFRLSPGTLDSVAGVFAPPETYRLGSAGGKGKKARGGGTILAMAVSSMIARPASSSRPASGYTPSRQAKHAFGAGGYGAVSGRAIGTMERTARRAPEVVVRITGRQHGGGHVLANFSYISRLGHGADKELALYTSDGDVLRDGRDMQILAQDWHEWEMAGDDRRKGATSISMILSMPTGTDPERLKDAALAFARDEFANRSWVASLHVDRDHPHVHLTVARRDLDGRRFHPDREDLFRYRQRFAAKLRDRGIEANATPARARGIDPKHEHIAARKVREKGAVPRIDISRAARAKQFVDRGVSDPVREVITAQQAAVRSAYERSIAELSGSPSLADRVIAKSLEKFVASLPAAEPNSARLMSPGVDEQDAGARLAAPNIGATETLDPVAAAIARSQAMRDRIAARGEPDSPDRRSSEAPPTRPSGVSDRLRSLMEEADRPSTEASPNTADEIVRRARERDRAERARDRSRDKDGPKR